MRIEVTQEDIDKADAALERHIQDDSFFLYSQQCPISQALKRVFPGELAISATQLITVEGKFRFEDIPNHVQQFINEWDDGETVAPIAFEIPYDEPQGTVEP